MPTRKYSGVVRLNRARAVLETAKDVYTLIPLPESLRLSAEVKKEAGEALFKHLVGQSVVVEGVLVGSSIFNAHLADSGLSVEDVKLAPGSSDHFAGDIEQYLKKDSVEVVTKLNAAGIRSISALYHRIRNNQDEEVAVFAKYLKVPPASITAFIDNVASQAENQALVKASPRFPVKRGVNLKLLAAKKGVQVKKQASTTPPKFPANAYTPDLPSKVDLVVHVTPVKDQGMRGTCVAHAAAACVETDLVKKGNAKTNIDLSEQYLYWACKNIDGAANDEGTFVEYAVEVLLNGVAKEKLAGGICIEKHWAYNSLPKVNNEAQGPLPVLVRQTFKSGKQHRIKKYSRLKETSIRALKRALAEGRCVALSVYTYHFWTDDYAWREGGISLPLGIEPDGAHAVCLVGYRDNDEDHGDGYFVFKNSWQTKWGYGRPDPGYGSLPYRYVLREAIEAYTIDT